MVFVLEWCASRIKGTPYRVDRNVSLSVLASLAIRRALLAFRGFVRLRTFDRVTFIGRGVSIRGRAGFCVGRGVTLGDLCSIDATSKQGVVVGDNVNIGPYCILQATGVLSNLGTGIYIGANSGIGAFSFIGGGGGVHIGSDVIMGQYVSFHSENHNYSDASKPIRLQGVSRQGIKIDDNCWIGAKVTFLDGTHVGSGSVVAAGAVVRGKFEPNSVLGGVPAKVIKIRTPPYPEGPAKDGF